MGWAGTKDSCVDGETKQWFQDVPDEEQTGHTQQHIRQMRFLLLAPVVDKGRKDHQAIFPFVRVPVWLHIRIISKLAWRYEVFTCMHMRVCHGIATRINSDGWCMSPGLGYGRSQLKLCFHLCVAVHVIRWALP